MKNPPPSSASLAFDQSTATPSAIVGSKSWWNDNRYRIGGSLRVVSRCATIASGMGYGTEKNRWRVGSGALGLLGGAFLAAFGERNRDEMTKLFGRADPELTGRVYHGIVATAGAAAVVAGMVSKPRRLTETVSGIWTLAWSAYAALAPEDEKKAPVFDKTATKAEAVGFAEKETKHSFLDRYKGRPKKLASDMLQFSALLVMADGVRHKDPWRFASGVTLGASNYLQREMRDADFAPIEQPAAGR